MDVIQRIYEPEDYYTLSMIHTKYVQKIQEGVEVHDRLDGLGEGILAGVRIPKPWATGQVVESPHPLKVKKNNSREIKKKKRKLNL